MKISELAERTRVPKETIHYYLREGVLRKPRKAGKNIADYNENYVEQIRIIKQLQEHYFLPLSVIKKIIRRHQKQSSSEKYSLNFLSEYFRPLDRLIAAAVTGQRSLSGGHRPVGEMAGKIRRMGRHRLRNARGPAGVCPG